MIHRNIVIPLQYSFFSMEFFDNLTSYFQLFTTYWISPRISSNPKWHVQFTTLNSMQNSQSDPLNLKDDLAIVFFHSEKIFSLIVISLINYVQNKPQKQYEKMYRCESDIHKYLTSSSSYPVILYKYLIKAANLNLAIFSSRSEFILLRSGILDPGLVWWSSDPSWSPSFFMVFRTGIRTSPNP